MSLDYRINTKSRWSLIILTSVGILWACLSGSLPAAPAFADGQATGIIATHEVWEASGIVASRQNPGVIWTHNDSGYRGTVFAISTSGALLQRLTITNVYSGDYEDVAIGPGPNPGWQYLYLGDIGDNYTNRPSIRVFRYPEPAVYHHYSNAPINAQVVGAQEIELQYPDGPYNAEALMVDPITGDLFIATKQTNSCRIYRATRAEMSAGGPISLAFMREISFRSVSAGDISPDGSMVALRRNNRISVWTRQPGQTISDALAGTAINAPVIGQPDEPNGEGLGFDPENGGYYTISEGDQPAIYYFRRTDVGKPPPARVLIGSGENWRYQDFGLDFGSEWRNPEYDDSWWMSGPAQLGYGQGDEATEVMIGAGEYEKNPTTYFRKSFLLSPTNVLTNLVMRICYNDGAAVYLNGLEIFRRHLPGNADFYTPATVNGGQWQNVWLTVPVNPAWLQAGQNIVAAELHRFAPDGPDLSFDLQLREGKVELPARFAGPPQITQNECRLNVLGRAGELVWLDAASDVLVWQRAGAVILTNGTGVFRESFTNGPLRVYRIGQ